MKKIIDIPTPKFKEGDIVSHSFDSSFVGVIISVMYNFTENCYKYLIQNNDRQEVRHECTLKLITSSKNIGYKKSKE